MPKRDSEVVMPACSRQEVGGQAVIEGVMMRSARSFAVVCRRPNGEIVVKEDAWQPVWNRFKFLRWPFLRGGVALLEAMVNGISALSFSANQQVIGEQDVEAAKAASRGTALADARSGSQARAAAENDHNGHSNGAANGASNGATNGASNGAAQSAKPGKPGKPASAEPEAASRGTALADARDGSQELSKAAIFLMVATSIAFGMALFVGAPHLLTWLLGFDSSSFAFHLVDGVIKLAILIGYLGLIGLMPDIRRVFQYHGAEHKAIYTYEQNLPLTVENARKQTRFHPRCGTSFLLIVITVSIVLFAVLLQFRIADSKLLDNLAKIAIKIPLMFPVAGIAYEAIKLSGRFAQKNLFVRILTAPGLALQNLTTREPTDDQLEIALVSIRKTLWRERLIAAEAAEAGVPRKDFVPPQAIAPAAQPVQVFAGFAEVDLPLA